MNLASTRAELGQRDAALAAAREAVKVADAAWAAQAAALLDSLQRRR